MGIRKSNAFAWILAIGAGVMTETLAFGGTVAAAPEIDAGPAASAITLLAGATAIAVSRWRRR